MSYSIDTPTTDDPTVDKFKKLKLRIRSQTLKVESENPTVIESILYVKINSSYNYLWILCASIIY